jgi:ankyrin repeat protein
VPPELTDSEFIDPGLTEAELELLAGVFDLARNGDAAQIEQLLGAGLPVNLTNSAGDTLLLLAAYHAHPDLVTVLLQHGADTSRVNDRGQTALGAAVFRRSEPVVRALLTAGADPQLGSQSARAVAAFFELPEMMALLDERQG